MGQQKINALKPDRSINGATIQRGTIAGRKSQFALQSSVGRTSFSISAGSTQWVSITATFWPTQLPAGAQNLINLITAANCFPIPIIDAHIDVDDGTHYIGGSGLTSAQLGVTVSVMLELSPEIYSGSTPYTATALLNFHNFDSNPHTVFLAGQFKYIITGDAAL